MTRLTQVKLDNAFVREKDRHTDDSVTFCLSITELRWHHIRTIVQSTPLDQNSSKEPHISYHVSSRANHETPCIDSRPRHEQDLLNEDISAIIDLVVEERSSYAEDREPIQSPTAPTRPVFGRVASHSVPSVISTLWLTPPVGAHAGPKTRLPSGTYSSFGLPSAESQSTDRGGKFEGDLYPGPPSAISTLYLTPPSHSSLKY